MVQTCVATLRELAEGDPRIVVLGADFCDVGEALGQNCSKQYIEMGIAESNLIGAAGGMSTCGLIPYVYAVAPFLAYRANEFIRDDLCMQKRNVKILAFSAGMDYSFMGPAHYTTEDIAMLRAMPNLTVLCPASAKEVREMVRAAAEIPGPVYIRLGRERNREIHEGDYSFELGKAVELHCGGDAALVSTGTISWEALRTVKLAEKKGVHVRLLHMGTLKPFDSDAVLQAARETKRVITLEEHSVIGGLGGAVCETISTVGLAVPVTRLGLPDIFASGYGYHDDIKRLNGLDVPHILEELCRQT